jgi:hypothetical protein
LHEYKKPFSYITDREDAELLLIKCDYSMKSVANNDEEVGENEEK